MYIYIIVRYAIITHNAAGAAPRRSGELAVVLGAYYAYKKFRFAQKESTPVSRLARPRSVSLADPSS